jgi:hypothetical protein
MLSTKATAQTVTLDFDDTEPSIYSETVSGNSGDAGFSGYAGVAYFKEAGQFDKLGLFCVELGQDLSLGSSTTFSLLPASEAASVPPSDPNYDASTGLEDRESGVSSNIPNGGIGDDRAKNLEILYYHVFGSDYNPTSLTSTQDVALQLAVWKLSQDDSAAAGGTNSLTSSAQGAPHLWVSSVTGAAGSQNAVLSLAQSWVSYVAENPGAPIMALSVLHNPTAQDFLIPTANAIPVPLPESSAYATVLGICVLGVAIVRRRMHSGSI